MVEYDSRIYDNHTLHVDCNIAEEDQIEEVLRLVIAELSEKLGRPIECDYYINVTRNRDGISNQIAYVWVSNSQVYHVIVGNNPDGSRREEIVECLAPIVIPDHNTGSETDTPAQNWADIVEEEENRNLIEQGISNVKRREFRELGPLIRIPEFTYTEEQRAELEEANPDELIPHGGKLIFSRAFVGNLGEGDIHNMLFAHAAPSYVTIEQIRAEFLPFCTKVEGHRTNGTRDDTQYRAGVNHSRGGHGNVVQYPLVQIRPNRNVRVLFHPETSDAQFALHLKKKIYFENPEVPGGTFVMIFHQGHVRP